MPTGRELKDRKVTQKELGISFVLDRKREMLVRINCSEGKTAVFRSFAHEVICGQICELKEELGDEIFSFKSKTLAKVKCLFRDLVGKYKQFGLQNGSDKEKYELLRDYIKDTLFKDLSRSGVAEEMLKELGVEADGADHEGFLSESNGAAIAVCAAAGGGGSSNLGSVNPVQYALPSATLEGWEL